MHTECHFLIQNSRLGFRDYLHHTLLRVKNTLLSYEKFTYSPVEPETYAMAMKIKELDDKFMSRCSEMEKKVLRYFRYHRKDIEPPDNYKELLESAYRKWYQVFFNRGVYKAYQRIDYKHLDRLLIAIRKEHNVDRSKVAHALGVNVRTIESYEIGLTPPTMEYLYLVSQIFSFSIDELLKKARIE